MAPLSWTAAFHDLICVDYLVEIFLPLADKAGETFPTERFSQVMEVLKRKFGGVTVYDRSPAKGKTVTSSDDIVIFEVMTDDLERAWWSSCRARLEAKFAQDEVLIRAASIERLKPTSSFLGRNPTS